MKIALLTQGSRGDVEPFIRLGKALQRRGHIVTVSAPLNFTDLIESAGLLACPTDMDIEKILSTKKGKELLKANPFAIIKSMKSVHAFTERSLDIYYRLAIENDRIIYHTKTMCDCFAHLFEQKMIRAMVVPAVESTKEFPSPALSGFRFWHLFPKASYFLQNFVLWSMRKPISRFAAKNNINLISDSPNIDFIYGISEVLVKKPKEYSHRSVFTGFWNDPDSHALSPDIEEFIDKGKKPVIITFGSMVNPKIDNCIRDLINILLSSKQRIILIRGWNKSDYINPDPDNLLILDSAPYETLFKKASALISHGGIGTVSTGLQAGLPVFTIPIMYPVGDQMFWGKQLEKIGVSAGTIPIGKTNKINLSDAMHRLISDESLLSNAQRIKSTLMSEDGLGKAVEIIERQ